jgi:DNA-binding transcriptional ArsR family regulator
MRNRRHDEGNRAQRGLSEMDKPLVTRVTTGAPAPPVLPGPARELSLSGATISVHLSMLKRCGMVTSWRSGRRVLYQRTPLASSILASVIQPGS